MTITPKRALGALLAACALLLAIAAPSASASSVGTANACRFSVDDYFRDLAVTIDGSATVLSDASGRYVDPAEVVPGLQVKLSGATVDATLPAWMPEFGYNTGLLEAGLNTISTKVWVAIEATNTKEGSQTVGPIDVTATTTITTGAGGNFVSATPIAFDAPTLPDLTWTATGGDIELSQASGGAITQQLPVGPSGTLQSVIGSFVVVADSSGARFGLDCEPGAATGQGATHDAATALPFDVRAGTLNETCLSGLGRQVSGARADLPTGLNRELEPLAIAFDGSAAPMTYTPGAPLALSGARIRVTIPAAVIRVLGRYIYANGVPLAYADKDYEVIVWAAIKGTNTAEGTQTVRLPLTYRLHPLDDPLPASQGSIVTWAPTLLEGELPTTSWTPTGTGPVAFSQADPGDMAKITVIGKAEPNFDDYPYDVNPYGTVFVRASTERYGESLDCIPGAVTAIDTAYGWSNLGRLAAPFGSAGRYSIAESATKPVFATATAAVTPSPPPPAAVVPPPPAALVPPPPPPPPPPPAAVLPSVAKLGSTALATRSGKVRIVVACAAGGSACNGVVAVRTASKMKVGSRRAIVTVAKSASYTVAAGASKTLSLTLSSSARTLLKRATTSVLVKVTLTAGGKAKTSTAKLRK